MTGGEMVQASDSGDDGEGAGREPIPRMMMVDWETYDRLERMARSLDVSVQTALNHVLDAGLQHMTERYLEGND